MACLVGAQAHIQPLWCQADGTCPLLPAPTRPSKQKRDAEVPAVWDTCAATALLVSISKAVLNFSGGFAGPALLLCVSDQNILVSRSQHRWTDRLPA